MTPEIVTAQTPKHFAVDLAKIPKTFTDSIPNKEANNSIASSPEPDDVSTINNLFPTKSAWTPKTQFRIPNLDVSAVSVPTIKISIPKQKK